MKSKSKKIKKTNDWRLSSTGKPSKALINLLSSGNRILEKKEFNEMKKPGSPYNKVAKELSKKRKIWRKKVIDSFSKKKFRDSITIRRYMYDTTTGNGHLYEISKLIGEKLFKKDVLQVSKNVDKKLSTRLRKTVKPTKKKTVKKTRSTKQYKINPKARYYEEMWLVKSPGDKKWRLANKKEQIEQEKKPNKKK